jgi:hypothetical protein
MFKTLQELSGKMEDIKKKKKEGGVGKQGTLGPLPALCRCPDNEVY